jgi:hypothetical protein
MDARVLVACLAMTAWLDAAAGGIYKCVDRGVTSYQSAPCVGGQDRTPTSLARLPADAAVYAPVAVAVAAPVAQPRRRGPWTHATVEIGISDDEVLNMPGWGRPAQISRVRGARGWEEVWRYGDPYRGERALRFVNARLADMAETPAALASSR